MSPLPPLADFRASHAPAVVILGNDALLAARPATPVQLAHACLAAGFRAAVPGSWGDELVADATLTALSTRAARPAIHCACPHVARRVLAVGPDLAPHLVSLVAPPVAAARYLRLHSEEELRVTYVGRCPAAADDAIDARLTPEELLAQLVDRGIDLAAQPEVFESVIPPDRRRHLSLPGGIPSAEILWERTQCAVATMKSGEFAAQLAELLLAGADTVIDPAPIVGCACAGWIRGESGEPRAGVTALEPPRSAWPVVEDAEALHLALSLPAVARTETDLVTDAAEPAARDERRVVDGPVAALGDAPPPPPSMPNRRPRLTPPGIAAVPAPAQAPLAGGPPPRRRSPIGTPRVVPGAVPFASDSAGRILPRAYVARRRSPRSGIPAVNETGREAASPPSAADAMAVHAAPVPPPAAPVAEPPATTTPAALPERQQASAPPAAMQHTEIVVTSSPARSDSARHAASKHDDDAARPRPDTERPVVRSVEPAVARGAGPAVVTTDDASITAVAAEQPVRQARVEVTASPTTAWSARIGSTSALLRRNPRALVAVILAAAGVLVGVAIGYSAGRRGGDQSRAATGSPGSPVDSAGDAMVPRSSGARESVSAGGLAPVPTATRRATRTGARKGSAGTRGVPAGSNVRPDGTTGSAASTVAPAAAPVVPPPSSSAGQPADTATARAQRDSVARSNALNAERDAIRREIDLRRARVDSIDRARLRLDSLRRAEQTGARPPRR